MKTGARGDIARGVRTPSTAVLSFGRIMRLSRLWDKKTKDFPAEHGLEPGEYGILSTLRRSGEPYELTAGTFLKASPVSSSAPPTATRSRGRHGRAGRRPTRGASSRYNNSPRHSHQEDAGADLHRGGAYPVSHARGPDSAG